MTNFEFGMSIAKLVLDIAREIVDAYMNSGDISEIRIKDLKAWREWEKVKARPNMKKLLEEYRKIKNT